MGRKKVDYTLPMFDKKPMLEETTTELRSYQERVIRLIRMHVDSGKKSVLVAAPTRSGKTVVIASIVRTSTLPVLFLAHRLELLDQCAEELQRAGIASVGIIRADDERTNPSASVQVASVATLIRRDKPWAGREIIIIIDEAHRAASDSYRDLIACWPGAIVIGFTATPCRLDGRPLGDLFEVLENAVTYQELLKNPKWLVSPDIYAPPAPDLSKVQMRGSDYDEEQAAVVMRAIEGDVVSHWMRRAHMHPVFTAGGARVPLRFVEGPRRRTFGFACNIASSLSFCTRFEREGIKVAHLDGETPETDRRSAIKALAKGEIEILFNVNILLEGVNIPEAKCVIHARPTQSLTLWRQSACRILTPWEDEKFGAVRPLLLDHAGNTERLDLPHIDLNWSLTSRPVRRNGAAQMKICKACFAYVEVGKTLCPHCGFEFPRYDPRPTQETAAELVARSSEPEDAKKLYFAKMVQMAQSKGFSPGFASVKYKEHYGVWPPRPWSDAIKIDFSHNKLWQEQQARRLAKKAEREAREAEEKRHMDAPGVPAQPEADPYNIAGAWAKKQAEEEVPWEGEFVDDGVDAGFVEGESPFGDWLEEQGIY
jgi:DNA repair protein RadD